MNELLLLYLIGFCVVFVFKQSTISFSDNLLEDIICDILYALFWFILLPCEIVKIIIDIIFHIDLQE